MENYQDRELLEMREQLHLLKEKLNQELIVNDRLLREVTRQKVRRLKHIYREWLRYGIPAIVVWMGWFSYEIIRVCDNWHVGISMIIGGVVGGIVGGAIGLHNHKKLLREMDELIEDIEQN